jgi:hypothetical protein
MGTEVEESPSSLEDVRLAIFRQHTQLEQLLDELEARANAVLAGEDGASRLRDSLRITHTRFLRHLAYEESRLVPWLRLHVTAGDDFERELLAEHVEQRARADGLLHDASVYTDARTFAREALTFVHAIRRDMAEEDTRLRSLR